MMCRLSIDVLICGISVCCYMLIGVISTGGYVCNFASSAHVVIFVISTCGDVC